MEDSKSGTNLSVKQFKYCSFCHLNHKKWKKHVYSKRHQEIMKKILDKFSSKLKSVKVKLDQPEVKPSSFESNAKVWCYFCAEDVDKHTHTAAYSLVFGAFIDHLASNDHLMNTNKFLHSNLLDKDKLNQFVIDGAQIESFVKKAGKAISEYEEEIKRNLNRKARVINLVEEKRKMSVQKWRCELTSQTDGRSSSKCQSRSSTFPKAVKATGEGVTSILQPNEKSSEGNIFSGAVPPWLRSDPEDDPNSRTIGPTMEDYQKHLESEKKGKLPANRVGAHFDHSASTSQNWLPSFGRVWSKGRRLQSKNFFEKSSGFKRSKGTEQASVSSKTSSSHVGQSGSIQPYQKKRPTSADNTNPWINPNSSFTTHPVTYSSVQPLTEISSDNSGSWTNPNISSLPQPVTNWSVEPYMNTGPTSTCSSPHINQDNSNLYFNQRAASQSQGFQSFSTQPYNRKQSSSTSTLSLQQTVNTVYPAVEPLKEKGVRSTLPSQDIIQGNPDTNFKQNIRHFQPSISSVPMRTHPVSNYSDISSGGESYNSSNQFKTDAKRNSKFQPNKANQTKPYKRKRPV